MKTLVFCGDKWNYGLSHLEMLLNSKFNIIGAILPTLQKWRTLLEKHTGQKLNTSDVFAQRLKANLKKAVSRTTLARHPKIYAKIINAEVVLKKHKVPFWRVDDINATAHINRLKKLAPDLILCAGFPQIFSGELLAIPKKGAVNFHPSLLPKFRGPSPFFWVIAKGETESGITAHFMTDKIDAGGIIAQIGFPIQDFTYQALVKKSIEETPRLIEGVYTFFSEGQRQARKQDESKASYYRYHREEDHRILWDSQDVHQIHNLTRTGRAFCFLNTHKVGITQCSTENKSPNLNIGGHTEEGTVVRIDDDSVTVKALGGIIRIQEFLDRGRKIRPKECIKRLNIQRGTQFN